MRKRKLPYRFVRKFVIIPLPMFKDFNIPVEYFSSTARDLNDNEISAKLARPYRTFGETAELADGINVKNKKSIVIEMSRDLAKDFFPFSKAEEVIDGIEHAHNRVETFRDTKVCHALTVKTDVRQFLAREREHLPGAVEARDFVSVGKKTQDAPCAGSNFKDRFCLRLVSFDETTGKVRRL